MKRIYKNIQQIEYIIPSKLQNKCILCLGVILLNNLVSTQKFQHNEKESR